MFCVLYELRINKYTSQLSFTDKKQIVILHTDVTDVTTQKFK